MTSSRPHGVAVLISTRRHPVSALPCPNPNDVVALAMGLQLSPSPRVVHAGEPQDAALTSYLAFGAAAIEVLPVDPNDRAAALAGHLHDTRLLVCGARAHNGSGMLPYRLAASLNRPLLGDVLDVQSSADIVTVTQLLRNGRRRKVEMPLPAIIAVHPQAAVAPRYIHARRVTGRIVALRSDSRPELPARHDETACLDATERGAVVLKAADRRSAHARMSSATAAATAAGGRVVVEESITAKARILLAYLRDHRLIDL